ncbi:adenylate kinase-domain-containing protein [Tirmania nivea]|nr:adenylate kinase-domain-containing protein [Tirmania nivea]
MSILSSESMDLKQINIFFILGGPGSGKGSISKRILTDPAFQEIAHVSIGDVLRVEIKQKGVDGPLIEQTMKDGKLLPWATILQYLRKGIDSTAKEAGKMCILLDGFPRMVLQAKLFEELKEYKCRDAILLHCSREEMLRRTAGRQDTDQRVDDNHATVLKRIEGYFAETVPVAEYFRTQGKLIEVSSEGTVEETYAQLRPLLQEKILQITTG